MSLLGNPGVQVTETTIYIRQGFGGTVPPTLDVVLPGASASWAILPAPEVGDGYHKAVPAPQNSWEPTASSEVVISTTETVTADTFDEIWLVLKYKGTNP